MKIMIVDDKQENRYFLGALFQGSGYDVIQATNGEEALLALRETGVDVIITDILMPNMDGFELCRTLKGNSQTSSIPIVFYTATYTDKKDEDFALKLGAARFILKPKEPEALLEIVSEVIHEAGIRPVPDSEVTDKEEAEVYRLYSERLVRKLEKKAMELEAEREERKRAEGEIKTLAHAVRSITESLSMTDLEGNIIFVNKAFEEEFGYRSEDLLGQHARTVMAEENDDDVLREMQERTLAGGWKGTLQLKRRDGSTFPSSVSRSLMRDDSDKAVAIINVSADISEQKKLEEQFRQSQKMEAVGRLAGGVAHDFNNILTVINGYSEMLLHSLDENDPMSRELEEIRRAGNRAASLTRQLLAFSRRQVLQPAVLNVSDIVENMEKMLRRLIGEHIEFTTSTVDTGGRINADPGQIEQIIMNLVVNARDAMPDGGRLTVALDQTAIEHSFEWDNQQVEAGCYMRLAFEDTGVGMNAETLEHIFEPFFTTKGEGKGTGLGLAMVYGIIQQSGGFMKVLSEPGKGTRFELCFPCVQGETRSQAKTPQTAKNLRGSETVLVAEDEDHLLKLIGTILRTHGYKVLEAPNGGSALLKCETHDGKIDLVLSDVIMPEMDGRQLVERLVLIRPEMKVLFMSGYTDDAIIRHGVLEEKIRFLQKPFSPNQLLEKIRLTLES